MNRFLTMIAAMLMALAVCGCAHAPPTITPVPSVDIDRFMGDWYVIAHIPTRFERTAFNAVESYSRRADGRIETTFRYRDGSFDAPEKTMHPLGTPRPDAGGAVWDMRFFKIFDSEYVIVDLASDYSQTIIGRSARDYAWIMARTPQIDAEQYARAVERLRSLGYATDALRVVPQRWPVEPKVAH